MIFSFRIFAVIAVCSIGPCEFAFPQDSAEGTADAQSALELARNYKDELQEKLAAGDLDPWEVEYEAAIRSDKPVELFRRVEMARVVLFYKNELTLKYSAKPTDANSDTRPKKDKDDTNPFGQADDDSDPFAPGDDSPFSDDSASDPAYMAMCALFVKSDGSWNFLCLENVNSPEDWEGAVRSEDKAALVHAATNLVAMLKQNADTSRETGPAWNRTSTFYTRFIYPVSIEFDREGLEHFSSESSVYIRNRAFVEFPIGGAHNQAVFLALMDRSGDWVNSGLAREWRVAVDPHGARLFNQQGDLIDPQLGDAIRSLFLDANIGSAIAEIKRVDSELRQSAPFLIAALEYRSLVDSGADQLIETVGSLGSRAEPALKSLVDALAYSDKPTQRAATIAIKQIFGGLEDAPPIIQRVDEAGHWELLPDIIRYARDNADELRDRLEKDGFKQFLANLHRIDPEKLWRDIQNSDNFYQIREMLSTYRVLGKGQQDDEVQQIVATMLNDLLSEGSDYWPALLDLADPKDQDEVEAIVSALESKPHTLEYRFDLAMELVEWLGQADSYQTRIAAAVKELRSVLPEAEVSVDPQLPELHQAIDRLVEKIENRN